MQSYNFGFLGKTDFLCVFSKISSKLITFAPLYPIEVNLAKLHGENFECGLCENTANDLETLDTHLGIYEIYKCKICGEQILKLTNIPTHVK